MENYISKYCIIKPNEVIVDGKLEFSNQEHALPDKSKIHSMDILDKIKES